ncbi:hypothetical protein C8R45DRAFT_1107673 [Mycena sanguinolenta]|nr:hypothetical protein C8R45DRAFT_1107673 [Mycena sanguinolenta]
MNEAATAKFLIKCAITQQVGGSAFKIRARQPAAGTPTARHKSPITGQILPHSPGQLTTTSGRLNHTADWLLTIALYWRGAITPAAWFRAPRCEHTANSLLDPRREPTANPTGGATTPSARSPLRGAITPAAWFRAPQCEHTANSLLDPRREPTANPTGGVIAPSARSPLRGVITPAAWFRAPRCEHTANSLLDPRREPTANPTGGLRGANTPPTYFWIHGANRPPTRLAVRPHRPLAHLYALLDPRREPTANPTGGVITPSARSPLCGVITPSVRSPLRGVITPSVRSPLRGVITPPIWFRAPRCEHTANSLLDPREPTANPTGGVIAPSARSPLRGVITPPTWFRAPRCEHTANSLLDPRREPTANLTGGVITPSARSPLRGVITTDLLYTPRCEHTIDSRSLVSTLTSISLAFSTPFCTGQ